MNLKDMVSGGKRVNFTHYFDGSLWYIRVTPNNKLLIFMRAALTMEKYWFNGYKFTPNEEVSGLEMSNNIGLDKIAFPLHREAIQRY